MDEPQYCEKMKRFEIKYRKDGLEFTFEAVAKSQSTAINFFNKCIKDAVIIHVKTIWVENG